VLDVPSGGQRAPLGASPSACDPFGLAGEQVRGRKHAHLLLKRQRPALLIASEAIIIGGMNCCSANDIVGRNAPLHPALLCGSLRGSLVLWDRRSASRST
jgi:hypothetical protein